MGLLTGDQIFHVSPSPREVHPITTIHPLCGNHQDWFPSKKSLSSCPEIIEFCQKVAPFVVVAQPTDASFYGLGGFQHLLWERI